MTCHWINVDSKLIQHSGPGDCVSFSLSKTTANISRGVMRHYVKKKLWRHIAHSCDVTSWTRQTTLFPRLEVWHIVRNESLHFTTAVSRTIWWVFFLFDLNVNQDHTGVTSKANHSAGMQIIVHSSWSWIWLIMRKTWNARDFRAQGALCEVREGFAKSPKRKLIPLNCIFVRPSSQLEPGVRKHRGIKNKIK